MFIVQIAAILILVMAIARKWRVELADAIPVGVSVLTLVLYGLAFLGALSLWDVLAGAILAAGIVYLWRIKADGRKELFAYAGQELTRPASVIAFFMVLVVTVAVKDKVVSWWDDYNFWATDVKSLFYLNGFAGKYANAAAEFGDYPPGTQMMKWLFLHFSPDRFQEGLMFAGYYIMNLSFLFPLLRFIRKRNPLAMFAGAAALWLFPAVAEVFWCDGCCADLTMAVIFGAFLMAVVDREGRSPFFYYGRQALFLMVLVLCKNTGFLWVAFGLLFCFGYHVKNHTRSGKWGLLAVTVLPALTEASWLGFCLLHRRVAKLTGTAVSMVTGEMGIPGYQAEMVKAFGEAFVKWPLHRSSTFSVDLSPLALFILLLLAVVLLGRFHILEKKAAKWLGIFLGGMGVLFYGINLISHLTIFAVETQYLEPYGMVSSIERYGAPFTIGSLYLLGFLCMRGVKSRWGMIICLVFVLFTTDYKSAGRALFAYRENGTAELERREEMIDAQAEQFLQRIGAGEPGKSFRVLYLRDISDVSWVRNTYINFEAAPVSVMYGNIDAEGNTAEDVRSALVDAHAGYLYVDELEGNGKALFADALGGEEFQYGCLYEVSWTDQGMRLTACAGGE